MEMFLLMLVGHALADYPLQGDFLARAKNRTAPIPGVPWWQAMSAHALIHAGFVGIITMNVALAAAEFGSHWLTDDLKCRGKISFNTDQTLHVLHKAAWTLIAVGGVA